MRANLSRAVTFVLPLVLVSSLAASAVYAEPPSAWDVAPQQEESVPGVTAKPLPRPADRVAEAAWRGGAAAWPAPGSAMVDTSGAPGRVRAGNLPVSIQASKADPAGRVRTEVLDRATAAKAGRPDSLLVRVGHAGAKTVSSKVSMQIDYSSFRHAYGGDWASRLRLWALPACALETPELKACRATPLMAINDVANGTITADVSLPAAVSWRDADRSAEKPVGQESTLVAMSSGDSGTGGSYSATSLSPSATWQSGGPTGDFSWNYPLHVPPGLGGPTPEITFAYSAGAVDGRISSANSQPSWIGEGFDYMPGFVERRYKGCQADGSLPTGDQCWFSDNATISLNGRASEVVRDDATGIYRLKQDDGSKVERLTGASNGDLGDSVDGVGEYWKVTTSDGTRYYFGLHQVSAPPASAGAIGLPGAPVTNSTWTLPVVGNNTGEPCHKSVYADSWCQQAYRWNLDYVIDPHGNTLAYFYNIETNRYGFTLGDQYLPYTRGGTPARIEYGLRDGQAWTATTAPARVVFTSAERCTPGSACVKPGDYPDTPWSEDCPTGSCYGKWSPTFWTSKRLAKVTTQVLRGSAYDDVDEWTMTHEFPNPGDGVGTPVLWLKQIQQTGKLGNTDVSMPPVVFDGLAMDNRINTDGLATVRKWRMTHIYNETGGSIVITYAPVECTTTNLPANPQTNTKRCMPIRWTPPGGTEGTYWFHKYVIAQIDEVDGTGVSAGTTTAYEYVGPAAWHYDDDDGITPQEQKTWKQWRGYGTVRTRVGNSADGKTLTESRFYRGMHGDRLNPSGGTKSVTVTDSLGGVVTDFAELVGRVRETTTYLGESSTVVARTINDGWVSAPTATAVRPWATVNAAFADVSANRTQGQKLGGMRTNKIVKTFNSRGQVTMISDLGDESVAGDEECTRITYTYNPDKHLMALTSRVEVYALDCANVPATGEVGSEADVISDERTYYDGASVWGTPPTKGDVTKIEEIKSWSPTGRTYVTIGRMVQDAYGRGVESYNAAGKKTTTAYEPPTGGPVTAVVMTNPLGFAERTQIDPGNGAALATIDANGRRTDLEYDGLGRLTKAWLPGRNKGTDPPHSQFEYLVRSNGVTAVSTRGIRPDGSYNLTVELYDGLLRPRQTQVAAPGGGRTIADTYYNSRGQVVKQHGAFWNASSPTTDVLVVSDGLVPGQNRTIYDGAGRRVAEIFDKYNVEQWRTTAAYYGDRIAMTPPAGETPTEVIFDALGRTVELREYKGTTPTGAFDKTTYAYNRRSDQTQVKDSVGNVWSYDFDLRGRMISSTDPDKGTASYQHNDSGDLVSVTDSRGQKIFYEYDDLGRVVRTRTGSATGPVYTEALYDTILKGVPTSSTRYVNGNAYVNAVTGYDVAYRPLGTSVTLPASEGALAGTYTFGATYNQDGSVATTTSPAMGDLPEETVTNGYTAEGLAYSLSSPLGAYVASASYSPFADLTKLTLGASPRRVSTNFVYQEGSRRLDYVRTTREGGSGDVLRSTFSYDAAGNVSKVVGTAYGIATDTQCYTYDYLRRLTRAWTPGDGNCAQTPTDAAMGGPSPYWTDWTYDAVGNRTKQVEHKTAKGDVTTEYTYPAATQPKPHALTQSKVTDNTGSRTFGWAYDAAGNTTTRPTPSGDQTMVWDADGHLESVTQGGQTTTYVYDAEGNRLLRKDSNGTTAYIGDTELKLSSSGVKTATRYYVFGGRTIGVRTSAGLQWLIGNDQGTSTLSLNAANTASISRRYYTPFGDLRGSEPTWFGERGFVGGIKDPTGTTHLGAREYDPKAGRFLSVDPVMDQAQSQQMNGYAYADSNPTTYSDPSGLAVDPGGGGGGGGNTGGDTGGGAPGTGEPQLPPDLQAMLDEAKRVQGMSLLQVILEAGGEILKELLGINDIMNCFQKGDIVACISIVANIIPWAKLFKLPKLVKAIERAWSAVKAFWEKLSWAKKIVAQCNEFLSLARKAAREAAERAAAAAREAAEKARAAAKAAAEKAAAVARKAAEKVQKAADDAVAGAKKAADKVAHKAANAFYQTAARILPVSTKYNGSMFWSGPGSRAAAEALAGRTGRKTLEMTMGGGFLDRHNPHMKKWLTDDQWNNVWATVSSRFARGASGDVIAHTRGPWPSAVFWKTELGILQGNQARGKVTGITILINPLK